MSEPCVDHLIELFNKIFQTSENTVLVRGDDEPIYLPADENNLHHRVVFAHGFFASALHVLPFSILVGKSYQ